MFQSEQRKLLENPVELEERTVEEPTTSGETR